MKWLLIAFLILPIVMVLGVAMGSFLVTGSILIAEAFILATSYLTIALLVSRRIPDLKSLVEFALSGIKNVLQNPGIVQCSAGAVVNAGQA